MINISAWTAKRISRLVAAGTLGLSLLAAPFFAADNYGLDNLSIKIASAAQKKDKSAAELNETYTEIFAESPYLMTGLAVTPGGRVFVSFPRWEAPPPEYSIAEYIGGNFEPLAVDAPWGSVRRLAYDPHGILWALDEGKDDAADSALKTPRLAAIDVETKKVTDIYAIPPEALIEGSRLSDVRVDPVRRAAYLSDIGAGGIIVLDLASREAYRALTGIGEVRQNLQMIYIARRGAYNKLGQSCALELGEKGEELYFSALGGDIIYTIPTKTLLDKSLSVAARQKKISTATLHGTPTCGMVFRDTVLIMGDLSDEGLWALDFLDDVKKGALFDVGIDVRWADSLALDGNNDLYFTVTQHNYPLEDRTPYHIVRIVWKDRNPAKKHR